MATPYIGEIRQTSFAFAPKGWALCNGQLLPINQNQALFSLLGTMYGGDGRITFGLPNLQGRVPIHVGNGFTQGQTGGAVSHTLTLSEMPAHTHPLNVSSAGATALGPANGFLAVPKEGAAAYAAAANAQLASGSVGITGGSQAHNNLPPYLVINFIIALQGIFPSRN